MIATPSQPAAGEPDGRLDDGGPPGWSASGGEVPLRTNPASGRWLRTGTAARGPEAGGRRQRCKGKAAVRSWTRWRQQQEAANLPTWDREQADSRLGTARVEEDGRGTPDSAERRANTIPYAGLTASRFICGASVAERTRHHVPCSAGFVRHRQLIGPRALDGPRPGGPGTGPGVGLWRHPRSACLDMRQEATKARGGARGTERPGPRAGLRRPGRRPAAVPTAGLASLDFDLPLRGTVYHFTTPRGEVEADRSGRLDRVAGPPGRAGGHRRLALLVWFVVGRVRGGGFAWLRRPFGATLLIILGFLMLISGVLPIAGLVLLLVGLGLVIARLVQRSRADAKLGSAAGVTSAVAGTTSPRVARPRAWRRSP